MIEWILVGIGWTIGIGGIIHMIVTGRNDLWIPSQIGMWIFAILGLIILWS